MKKRKSRFFSCDFETTVYKGQTDTEVWAAASVELYTEDVSIFHSIDELYEYFISLKSNIVAYFHNLKFDGSFWLDFLMIKLDYKQAIEQYGSGENDIKFLPEKDMCNGSFKYSISDKGQWYTITIKTHDVIIEIRDSLKLLPFSVERIGKSFGTKHKKLNMEYTGFRYAGCEITDEEKKYIANDVLVVKEALEIMFQDGHDDLTIGACCLKEFKKLYGKEDYDMFFPDVYDIPLESSFEEPTVGDFVRKSYRGGWCYLVKGKEKKLYTNGVTADVNSLYPSVMHSESGNRYPVGVPKFWEGNIIPDEALGVNKYYFIRIKTRFYLKEGYLPFIQLKNTYKYSGTEHLETSDVRDPITGEYSAFYIKDGEVMDTRIELTLTMTDYKLLLDHYELVDFEILGGCWFFSEIGLFDPYINHYKEIKVTSKGSKRESAKLFLNNLYGKMASSKDSSFKLAYKKEGDIIGFKPVPEYNKKAGYIPIGSAITSYARNFTIRAAQANYHDRSERGFIYADTDSIHCDLSPEQISGIKVDKSAFCCWKLESTWDYAWFVRQKTYIEHVVQEDLEDVEPHYNVCCAGMPDKCKNIFLDKVKEGTATLEDFNVGLVIPEGRLKPKRIRGGILLVDDKYTMR